MAERAYRSPLKKRLTPQQRRLLKSLAARGERGSYCYRHYCRTAESLVEHGLVWRVEGRSHLYTISDAGLALVQPAGGADA